MFGQTDFRSRYRAEMERRKSEFLRRAIEKNPRTYLRRLRMLASLSAICGFVAVFLFGFALCLIVAHRISGTESKARVIVLMLAFALSACANFLWYRWYHACVDGAARSSIQI